MFQTMRDGEHYKWGPAREVLDAAAGCIWMQVQLK